MKDKIKSLKKIIIFYSILYLLMFLIVYAILKIFNITFRGWFFILSAMIIGLTFIIGILQLLLRIKSKILRRLSIVACVLLFGVLISFVLFISAFIYMPEHVVEKDNKKYVAYVNSWLDTDVIYYDYINFFLMGNRKKIVEYYYDVGKDVLVDEEKKWIPASIIYYDENEKVIKIDKFSNNESTIIKNDVNSADNEESNSENTDVLSEEEKKAEVLYEKKINELTSIRIVYIDSILAQRSLIGVQKTIDGGKNWTNQLQMSDRYLTIHNGAKYVFLNENIGFINDPGLAGTNGDNRGLLVTINGGKTFVNANIIKPDSIIAETLFVEDVPYIVNNILKVKIYTIDYHDWQDKTYYEFYSNDNGLNWKIYK